MGGGGLDGLMGRNPCGTTKRVGDIYRESSQ